MELATIARFHAREGQDGAVEALLRAQFGPVRAEPGCLAFAVYRATRDPRLFFIHARWRDEAAFEVHAELPHTVKFIERVLTLIDHPLDVTRTRAIDERSPAQS